MLICGEVRFLHISVVWFPRGRLLIIHADGACTAPRGGAVVFKGLHAVCFPGYGEGRYNNVMHS